MTYATFIKSAVEPKDYPEPNRPEVALVGRSNAGKSTLLNAMCGKKGLAKVSSTPGKTRLLNFFEMGEHYRIVDLPGYGYAARQIEERQLWAKMIADFMQVRTNLVGLVLLCDIRREWTDEEQAILEMAEAKGYHVICGLTKLDKLGRAEADKQYKLWLKTSGQEIGFFYPISAVKNDGVPELEAYIFKTWIKPLAAQGLPDPQVLPQPKGS